MGICQSSDINQRSRNQELFKARQTNFCRLGVTTRSDLSPSNQIEQQT